MISRLKGRLVSRDVELIEVGTEGGVVYELEVPLSIVDRLPPVGGAVEIRTLQVVREDSVALYGFMEAHERELFRRLLGATGVGSKLALAMLSTFNARRLARALAEKDLTALKQVSGIGKKTAERITVELADKVQDLAVGPEGEDTDEGGLTQEAVSALVALGYSFTAADEAVRRVVEDGNPPENSEELIRRALQKA